MPRLRDNQRKEKELIGLQIALINWYSTSLAQIPPTDDPKCLQAVVEAGTKLLGFMGKTGASSVGDEEKTADVSDILDAFGALKNAGDGNDTGVDIQ